MKTNTEKLIDEIMNKNEKTAKDILKNILIEKVKEKVRQNN